MSILAKQRAAIEFCRTHPGEAFDEGAYGGVVEEVEFSTEPWSSVREEIKILSKEHWMELEGDSNIPLDPDWEQYAQLEREGKMHVVSARVGEWLVGYDTGVVTTHIHHKGTLVCFTDIAFLMKEYRRGLTGYRMMKFFRDTVIARGVKKIYHATSLKNDLDPIFRRLGYKQAYRTYML